MKKTMILLTVGVLAFILGATSVFGIVPDNTTLTFQNSDATFTTTAVTTVAQGGNITNMSMNQTVQSSYWQAFYGDIVKTIFLADTAASNIVYDWGAQNLGGWVYFSNETGIDWSAVTPGNAADAADEDTTLGLTGAETVASTFGGTTHAAIADIGAGAVGIDSAVGVKTNGGSPWDTILLRGDATATSSAIYASAVQQDTANYAGDIVDYQIMVPVALGTGLRTYNVYAGLE